MRILTLVLSLFAFAASATTLQHTIQTGHKWSNTTGTQYQAGQFSSVEVTETGDADSFTIGTGCADCWEVDNIASGGSVETVVTAVNTTATTAFASGEAGEYCNTAIAVGGLYSAQNKEQGSGWSNEVTDAAFIGTVDRHLAEWGTSGNGGSESGSYTLTEVEHVDMSGTSHTAAGEVFDYTILTSIVE